MIASLFRYALVIAYWLLTTTVLAQTFPSGFSRELVANGISNPTALAFAPDGRIFVAQQGGKLRVIKNGALLPTAFIELTVQSSGERGLIGVTVDPDFSNNHYLYLYYTEPGSPPHNRIVRVEANGDVAGTITPVLDLDGLSSATNHNGGAMHFGKDGKLYVAIGENATPSNAQNLDTYHGKLLRINADGSVPEGNPFISGSEQKKRIWSYGLRNPYTFDVQPVTGKIFVNDVGQSTWEEINDATSGGLNFGWPTAEGVSSNANFTNPVYAYAHGSGEGKGCAITGGTFFNPSTTNYPQEYMGKYFYLEYCNNWIEVLDFSDPVTHSGFGTNIGGSSLALTTGNDGNLYYLSRSGGALYKIVYQTEDVAPYITQQPNDNAVSEGQSVTFSISVSGTVPFTYKWRKDNQEIPSTNSASYTISDVQPEDAGKYDVIVSNAIGSVTSQQVTLAVTPFNDPPKAVITTPNNGATYVAGTTINFSGSGSDPEDGNLSANRFSWQIDFHHDTHVHDQPAIEGVKSGTFFIPDQGETSDNVFYRITLTVSDSEGLKDQAHVDILPKKSTLSFETDPVGLEILLDGQPFSTPGSIVSVEGIKRSISVVSPQSSDDQTFEFTEWLHGGDQEQTIVTPTDNTTYIAKFSIVTETQDDLISSIQVYPNPVVNDKLILRIRSNRENSMMIKLKDVLSRAIHLQENKLIAGDNEIVVPMNSFSTGLYFLEIEMNGQSITRKVLVTKGL